MQINISIVLALLILILHPPLYDSTTLKFDHQLKLRSEKGKKSIDGCGYLR
jgi:hypothetical protein